MTNKEKELIIEALEALKNKVYFDDYLKSYSSMNIEEKAYAEEKLNNIDSLIRGINNIIYSDSDNEKIKLFDYLCNNWAHKAFNPMGNYAVISFTISDSNIDKLLDKYLKGERISMYEGEIKHV